MKRVVAASLGLIVGGFPVAVLSVVLLEVLPRLGRPRRDVDAIAVAAQLLVLVGAGLPIVAALETVAGSVRGVADVSRRARRVGSAVAMASATGPLGGLLRRLADAVASGSPPEPAIRSFIDTERRRRQTEAVERARRLPVRLMIPMTLLVLPGFVLMVYGPTFIDLVRSLIAPLTG